MTYGQKLERKIGISSLHNGLSDLRLAKQLDHGKDVKYGNSGLMYSMYVVSSTNNLDGKKYICKSIL